MNDSYWKWLGRGFRKGPEWIKESVRKIDWLGIRAVVGIFLAVGCPVFGIVFSIPLILLGWIPSFFLLTHFAWETREEVKEDGQES